MKIVIAYLYYDLLNLYGENGNINFLKNQLENQDIEVDIKYLSIYDKLKFNKYDLVVMSAGTENNQKIVIEHLIKYKDEIKKQIENGKFFLITGNSIDLFGKYLKREKKIKCLNIFNFTVNNVEKRIVNNELFKEINTKNLFIGFQNQSSIINKIKNPWFEVIKGTGYNKNIPFEGIHYKNFYGTYLIGPLLVRNPYFAIDFIKCLILSKDKSFEFKDFELEFEIAAYNKYIELNYSKEKASIN